MKGIRLLFVVGLLSMAAGLSAQETKFVEQGKCWLMHKCNQEAEPPVEYDFSYYLDGDTVIGGQACVKLYADNLWGNGTTEYQTALYETGQRVWFVPKGDTQAYLLYDFGAAEGSTFVVDDYTHPGDWSNTMAAQEVKSLTIRDVERRCLQVNKTLDGVSLPSGWWIEGVGSELGPLNTWAFSADGNADVLVCCRVGEEVLYSPSDLQSAITGIVPVSKCLQDDRSPAGIFDLCGRRLPEKPRKSFIIRKGQKMMVK